MSPDYEESYTEEDKTHIAEMNEKLAVEYEDAKRKERMSVTEAGNPRKPQGEAGKIMIERMNESHAEMTAWALDKLDLKPTDKVLDVGCGGGAALKRLSGRIDGGKLYGIDYSEVSVEASKELNKADIGRGKMEIHQGSVSKMPFEDNLFDAIITVESYYFWPDLEEDMREVFRVLKEGGTFMLIAEMYLNDDLDEHHIEMAKKFELRNLTVDEFKALFEKVGYKETKIHLKDGKYWICVEGKK
ncbi:class I SAM-dependent methyltransferase [Eubacterium limosum]|uniref:class I SAM-dependent methyltransferase n=1 Tax=Eubacterium limosum TaxID=1736 RepID=UPI00371C1BD2